MPSLSNFINCTFPIHNEMEEPFDLLVCVSGLQAHPHRTQHSFDKQVCAHVHVYVYVGATFYNYHVAMALMVSSPPCSLYGWCSFYNATTDLVHPPA